MDTQNIDIVVPWVNGADPMWLSEKRKYDGSTEDFDTSDSRYRDWNLLPFFFRGIEKNMPWVNKVFFVTWGHVPEWLNTEAEKLVIVNHKDYIPAEYLPTFNSNTIELNIHRIKGLSDHFIYFNDDMFPIDTLKPEWFFKDGTPRDMLVAGTLVNKEPDSSIWHIVFNDMGIINKYFHGGKSSLRNFWKWASPKYGLSICVKNAFKIWNHTLSEFWCPHITSSFKKSTYEKLWELEGDYLDKVCKNKFRTPYDINQWLMKYWQMAAGDFKPIDLRKVGQYCGVTGVDESLDKACELIRKRANHILCVNDTLYNNSSDEVVNECERRLIAAFSEILPDKCSFEK
ncbi:MAG: Stealth CR1 domain-containing protein [Lachnospiraceae bacterium]|nr:Stealth CR1 domain-containing protein [Lachnospiraceae bacterium]